MGRRYGVTRWIAVLVAFLASLGLPFLTIATSDASPIQASIIHGVQWANVTDSGFTVAWLTDAAIPGSGLVLYGNSPATVSTPASESSPPPGARGDIHVVQITNLASSTSYFFAVKVGGVQDDNNGQYYEVRTGPPLSGQLTNRTVSGFVALPDGHTPASGALVSLKVLDNAGLNGSPSTTSGTLAAVTNSAGNWSIMLTPRTADFTNIFNYTTNGSSDFVQYSVEAASLGDTSQTVQLVLDGSGHLSVPNVSLTVSQATDTPIPTLTPTNTASPTVTLTSTPSVTATAIPTSENAPVALVDSPVPTTEPLPPTETPLPTSTIVSLANRVAENSPIAQLPIPTVRVVFPTVAAPNVEPQILASPTSIPVPPQQPIAPPAVVSTETPAVIARFPFVTTPAVSGADSVQVQSAATRTPAAVPSPRSTVTSGGATSLGRASATPSESLPPVAVNLLLVGIIILMAGGGLVSLGVSRKLRSSS